MRLRQIAIDPTPSIDASATAQEALKTMRLHGANALVVFAAKEIAGLVTKAQLMALSKGERDEHQAAGVATNAVPLTGKPTIKNAANALRRMKIDCVPVTDDGRVRKDRGPNQRVLTSIAEAPAKNPVNLRRWQALAA